MAWRHRFNLAFTAYPFCSNFDVVFSCRILCAAQYKEGSNKVEKSVTILKRGVVGIYRHLSDPILGLTGSAAIKTSGVILDAPGPD